MANRYNFDDFIDIIRMLRSEDGCPWDRVQTHKSLRSCMLEEAYEAVWAIDNDDMLNLKEELGDVLLQVALHSVISEQAGEFVIDDVIQDVADKMVRRHPHVFGDKGEGDQEDFNKTWEQIKQIEHKEKAVSDSMANIPRILPAVMRGEKVQKKAQKADINFRGKEEAFLYMENMLEKLKNDLEIGNDNLVQQEFGAFLFSVINLSVFLGLNAENSLTNSIDKFINKLVGIEQIASSEGKRLSELPDSLKRDLWQQD